MEFQAQVDFANIQVPFEIAARNILEDLWIEVGALVDMRIVDGDNILQVENNVVEIVTNDGSMKIDILTSRWSDNMFLYERLGIEGMKTAAYLIMSYHHEAMKA